MPSTIRVLPDGSKAVVQSCSYCNGEFPLETKFIPLDGTASGEEIRNAVAVQFYQGDRDHGGLIRCHLRCFDEVVERQELAEKAQAMER